MTDGENGWGAYKIAVLKQLEFLTLQADSIRNMATEIDKDLASITARITGMDTHQALKDASLQRRFDDDKDFRNEHGEFIKGTTSWREEVNRRLTVIETRSVVWMTALGIIFTVGHYVLDKFYK